VTNLTAYVVRPIGRIALLQLVSKALRQSTTNNGASNLPPGEGAQGATQRPLRILIAEDSTDNQLLVQMYLDDTAHHLTFVNNGQEAVHALHAADFDLVLMDLQMPVMDGLNATDRIRTMERRQGRPAIPIVALSANARPQDVRMSLEAGCNAHISKPISKRRLLAAVEEHGATQGEQDQPALSPGLAALVPRYLESRRSDAVALTALLGQGDFEAIRRIAHNLKGTGASYGFPDLTRLGVAIEDSANSSDAVSVGNQLRDLERFLANADAVEVQTRRP
jgi:CheY-like chemotaxis protein/HPt (histidine-containing phosphotransfer) domain-containing protein